MTQKKSMLELTDAFFGPWFSELLASNAVNGGDVDWRVDEGVAAQFGKLTPQRQLRLFEDTVATAIATLEDMGHDEKAEVLVDYREPVKIAFKTLVSGGTVMVGSTVVQEGERFAG